MNRRLRPATGHESPPAHPSLELCADLAGAPKWRGPGVLRGNVGDLADVIAQYLENAESRPQDRSPKPPTAAHARAAIEQILAVIEAAADRINELELQQAEKHD